MRRLISDVPFCDCDSYPCGHVALDAMLHFYGYATPLVLHDQWFFLYQRRENGDFQVEPRLSPVSQSLLRCGVHLTDHREPDGETAWAHAKVRIDSGHPVPALADTYNLEAYYYPGLGHHSDHYVILAGYDDEGGTVYVVDASPTKLFRGDLPLAGFKEAWGSEAIPHYTWLEFQLSEPRWTLSSEQARQALQQNIRLMFQENTPLPGASVGLQGLHALADDMARWRDAEPDQARAGLKRLFDQLRPVAMEREGHSKYLKLAADTLDTPCLTHVGEQLRVISQKWLVFRNLCFRGQKKALEQTLEKLPGRLLEIISLEEKALMQLRDVLEIR